MVSRTRPVSGIVSRHRSFRPERFDIIATFLVRIDLKRFVSKIQKCLRTRNKGDGTGIAHINTA